MPILFMPLSYASLLPFSASQHYKPALMIVGGINSVHLCGGYVGFNFLCDFEV